MSLADAIGFGQFLLLLGDGGDPEDFTAPCGLTSRGLTRSTTVDERAVPDPANQDGPAIMYRSGRSLPAEIAGSGVMAWRSFLAWEDYFSGADARNVQIVVGDSGSIYGVFRLTQFNLSGRKGEKVAVEIAMQSTEGIPGFVEGENGPFEQTLSTPMSDALQSWASASSF